MIDYQFQIKARVRIHGAVPDTPQTDFMCVSVWLTNTQFVTFRNLILKPLPRFGLRSFTHCGCPRYWSFVGDGLKRHRELLLLLLLLLLPATTTIVFRCGLYRVSKTDSIRYPCSES